MTRDKKVIYSEGLHFGLNMSIKDSKFQSGWWIFCLVQLFCVWILYFLFLFLSDSHLYPSSLILFICHKVLCPFLFLKKLICKIKILAHSLTLQTIHVLSFYLVSLWSWWRCIHSFYRCHSGMGTVLCSCGSCMSVKHLVYVVCNYGRVSQPGHCGHFALDHYLFWEVVLCIIRYLVVCLTSIH